MKPTLIATMCLLTLLVGGGAVGLIIALVSFNAENNAKKHVDSETTSETPHDTDDDPQTPQGSVILRNIQVDVNQNENVLFLFRNNDCGGSGIILEYTLRCYLIDNLGYFGYRSSNTEISASLRKYSYCPQLNTAGTLPAEEYELWRYELTTLNECKKIEDISIS